MESSEAPNRESIASLSTLATVATIATSVKRKPLSRDSVILSPTAAQQVVQPAISTPAEIEFALGPAGLHAWYDTKAQETEEASREEHSRYWSKDADDRVRIGEESLLGRREARTVQLYACSPSFVTATVFADGEGRQQHRVRPPYQSIIQRFGRPRREYERAVLAEKDLSDWLTVCLLNNAAPADLRVDFGPDDGFYAHAPAGRSRHRGLPIDLQEILANHADGPPEKVSLGVGSTWWIEWQDGKQEFYIQENSYPDLCALQQNIKTTTPTTTTTNVTTRRGDKEGGLEREGGGGEAGEGERAGGEGEAAATIAAAAEEEEGVRIRRIQLNPAKANEFVVEYGHKRFFVRARCSAQDLRSLNNYLREYAKDVRVVVLTSVKNALGKDLQCEPFVLPMYDFEASPIVRAKQQRDLKPIAASQADKPDWVEFTKTSLEMTDAVAETARAGGACSLM